MDEKFLLNNNNNAYAFLLDQKLQNIGLIVGMIYLFQTIGGWLESSSAAGLQIKRL